MNEAVDSTDINESGGSDLQTVVKMLNHQQSLEAEILRKEEELEGLKKQFRQLSENLIPDKMLELGLESLTLKDGSKVTISRFYSASIIDDKAFEWLRKSGHGGIVKSLVSTSFKVGQEKERAGLIKLLKQHKVPFENKDSVHHATLKAWVREMYENGQAVPANLFNVFVGNKSVIKQAT